MSLVQESQRSFDDPALVSARADLMRELRSFLPEDSVLEQEEELRPYECDGLTAYRQLPLLVVLPRDRGAGAAHHAPVPPTRACRWWPAAPAPGCPAAPCPTPTGVLLSLARFNRILEIDPAGAHGPGAARRAQPGHLRGRRRPRACTTRPDPSSQIACTIGGNVAENSGGVHCLKYGLTVHNILAAQAGHRGRRAARASAARRWTPRATTCWP